MRARIMDGILKRAEKTFERIDLIKELSNDHWKAYGWPEFGVIPLITEWKPTIFEAIESLLEKVKKGSD